MKRPNDKIVFRRFGGLGRFTRIICGAFLSLFVLSLISETVEASVDKYPSIFGTRERQYKSLKAFKKWTGMLVRFEKNQPVDGRPCDPPFHKRCKLWNWLDFLKSLEGKNTLEKITAVNKYQNSARYLTDLVNWKQSDYWATPGEFFRRNGDCEDFAIAKYMSLRKIGFTPADMRILVVQDLNLKIAHAVLVVYNEGRALILDNQIEQVIDSTRIRHYKPQYSINEEYWWRHR